MSRSFLHYIEAKPKIKLTETYPENKNQSILTERKKKWNQR